MSYYIVYPNSLGIKGRDRYLDVSWTSTSRPAEAKEFVSIGEAKIFLDENPTLKLPCDDAHEPAKIMRGYFTFHTAEVRL